jgi:hypothetical protein
VAGLFTHFLVTFQTDACPHLMFRFRYSFFPDEAEVMLSPNARFFVANEASLEVLDVAAARCCCNTAALASFDIVQADGSYYVDLIEKRGEGVIF